MHIATEDLTSNQNPEGAGAENPAVLAVDTLLAVEDPSFASAMSELKEQVTQADLATGPAEGAVAIEPLDLTAIAAEKNDFKSRIKTALSILKEYVTIALSYVKAFTSKFKALPGKSKLLLLLAVCFGVLAVMVFRMAFHSSFLPNLKDPFLHSFAEVADQRFEYASDAKIQDFSDPLSHPEYMILLNRVIVNLKSNDPDANPMGLFEFYFDASSDVSAVELKDREVEVRDVVGRTIETMSHDSLVGPVGKEKLKVNLRKNLNALLTKGQVRHVYIKTIVLKE